MPDPYQFISPFPLGDCAQRLKQLAAKEHFYADTGFVATHFRIQSLTFIDPTESETGFHLDFLGSTRGARGIPVMLYFRITGALRSSPEGTAVQLRHDLHAPGSAGDWAFVGFVSLVIGLALVGGVLLMVTAPPREALLIGAVLVLGAVAYTWLLLQVYDQSEKNLPKWICQALTKAPGPSVPQGRGAPDWVSTLSSTEDDR